MKGRRLHQILSTGLLLSVFLAALPAFAHHSYAAFDSTSTRTLKGAIKSFRWGNPHVDFKLLVEVGDKPEEWSIETHSPEILKRYGWTRSSLRRGDRVSIVCNPMSDGSYGCRLHTVLLLDTGRTLETKLSASEKSRVK